MTPTAFQKMLSEPDMALSVWIGNHAEAKRRRVSRKMTARQIEVLRFVSSFIKRFQYSPSIPEVSEGFGLKTKNGSGDVLYALIRKGYLARSYGVVRSMRLTDAGREFLNGGAA